MSSPVNSDSSPDNPSQRALILVVERNPAVQRLERFFLEEAGYSVVFANFGVSALAQAREVLPKILQSEILVARLERLILCRALKSGPLRRLNLDLGLSYPHR